MLMDYLARQKLALFVLCMSLGLTFSLWRHEQHNAALDTRASLDFEVRDVNSRIEQRMAAYEQVLRGAQALFVARTEVSRKEFAAYVNGLQLNADYAGMTGIGMVYPLPADKLPQHLASMQKIFPSYVLTPAMQDKWVAPIEQLEPFVGRNRELLGVDLNADTVQRVAMERARDAGMVAISGKFSQNGKPSDASQEELVTFFMYLPLYKNGLPGDTVALRRANLLGWIFAPVQMRDLMASLYGENAPATNIRIYDGIDALSQTLMYDSVGRARAGGYTSDETQVTEYITNAGHTWSVVISTLPGYAEKLGKDKSSLIAWSGSILSLMLTLLTWQLVNGRKRAMSLAREMTKELRASEERFRYLAQYDELTGLPNRAMLKDRLRHAILQARRDRGKLALMYLDLDEFKPINDTLGHHFGDLLLKAVAARMLACVRESDTVARIGGDEFVVLLPVIAQAEDAVIVAEKIRHAVNLPFEVDGGHVLKVSSSTGIALYPEHGADEIVLSQNADIAMYRAKESGRNQVQVFDAVRQKFNSRSQEQGVHAVPAQAGEGEPHAIESPAQD